MRALPVAAPIGAETRALQRRLALRLGANPLDKLAQGHAGLKLNLILRRRQLLVRGCDGDCPLGGGSEREPVS